MRFLAALAVSLALVVPMFGCGSTCKCDGEVCSNCSGSGTTTAPQGDGGDGHAADAGKE